MAGEDEAERTPPAAEQTTDQQAAQATPAPPVEPSAPAAPGFGERGRMRRRARFLRKARELAYRDLGGLVYDLHRFGQRNDQVVLAKLSTLGHIDAELRALETALHEIKPVTVLHEVGIAACPRCAAIHGNEDRFCPGCGLAFAAGADRPLSTAPVTARPPAAEIAATTTSGAALAASPLSGPADEPLTTIERPAAPMLKPTALPVAARPVPANAGNSDGDSDSGGEGNSDSAGDAGAAAERDSKAESKADLEPEPTRILRPPTGGA